MLNKVPAKKLNLDPVKRWNPLQAEIISIGDELLIGQTLDTNAHWLGDRLSALGLRVDRITLIPDREDAIVGALDAVSPHTDLVLTTGGLGPTHDDLTKEVLTRYFGGALTMDEEVRVDIERFFHEKGLPVRPINEEQARVPDSATVIRNPYGTAPGLCFEKEGCLFVAMPGVPHEMRAMVENSLVEWIRERYELPVVKRRTVLTVGKGESFLREMISDWERRLREKGIALAYLPSPGIVKLRLTAEGKDSGAVEALLDGMIRELEDVIPELIFGHGDDTLAGVVGRALLDKGETMATAESCTGGHIAHKITSVAGSSGYYKGGLVAYDNAVKTAKLGVDPESLEKEGAVSRPVVEMMAKGVREAMGVDHAIATSGIMGPSGGNEQKPVGTVWFGIASEGSVHSECWYFGKQRGVNIEKAAMKALELLWRNITKTPL